jgi:hypothetical protein
VSRASAYKRDSCLFFRPGLWISTISARSGSRISRYLSKLRDPHALARAISEALARADAKYAIADRFDDAKASTLA